MPNISRTKVNQTMKFGQLIECNMRNIFLEESYSKCGGKTSSRLFSENVNWPCLWINGHSFIQFVFIIWQFEGNRNILNLSCRPLAFTSNKVFLKKNKERPGTSLPASFSAISFEEKCFSCYILVVFILWDIWQYVYWNCL